MVYEFRISKKAKKILDKLSSDLQARILDYLEAVLEEPFSRGKPLTGNRLRGTWCYRIGDYRAVCDIQRNLLVITVVKIGHRCNVYEDA